MSYRIYNSSGHHMNEVKDNTVHVILSSPRYNAGGKYDDWEDSQPFPSFLNELKELIGECTRVLHPTGKLVIECADTALSAQGEYMAIGAIYSKLAHSCGLSLVERHVAYTLTKDGIELPERDWSTDFVATEATHSNAHQLLVFGKGSESFRLRSGRVLYYNYPENEEGHPSPFSWEMIQFVLDHYFSPGNIVLDPYMGTARLGRAVLRRGGFFIGYDINPHYCRIAEEYLSKAPAIHQPGL